MDVRFFVYGVEAEAPRSGDYGRARGRIIRDKISAESNNVG